MCGDLTSHTYNVEVIEEIVKDILQQFHPAFMEFEQSFKNRKIEERPGLMSHGLSPNTMATIHGILLRLPAVESATLHGSRAKGNHRPGSDIDLTLHGKNLTPAILADIEDALDDQLLPYTFGNYSGAKSTGRPANADLMESMRLRPCLRVVER